MGGGIETLGMWQAGEKNRRRRRRGGAVGAEEEVVVEGTKMWPMWLSSMRDAASLIIQKFPPSTDEAAQRAASLFATKQCVTHAAHT